VCNKEGSDDKDKRIHIVTKEKCIPYQLQRLFLQLQTVEKRAVETTDVTKSFGWDSSEGMIVAILIVLLLLAMCLDVLFK